MINRLASSKKYLDSNFKYKIKHFFFFQHYDGYLLLHPVNGRRPSPPNNIIVLTRTRPPKLNTILQIGSKCVLWKLSKKKNLPPFKSEPFLTEIFRIIIRVKHTAYRAIKRLVVLLNHNTREHKMIKSTKKYKKIAHCRSVQSVNWKFCYFCKDNTERYYTFYVRRR